MDRFSRMTDAEWLGAYSRSLEQDWRATRVHSDYVPDWRVTRYGRPGESVQYMPERYSSRGAALAAAAALNGKGE